MTLEEKMNSRYRKLGRPDYTVTVDEVTELSEYFDSKYITNLTDIRENLMSMPKQEAKALRCYSNVMNYVEKNPEAVAGYGWLVMPQKSFGFSSYIPHVIVIENGRYIDITPTSDMSRNDLSLYHQHSFLLDAKFNLENVKKFLFDNYVLGIYHYTGDMFRIRFNLYWTIEQSDWFQRTFS